MSKIKEIVTSSTEPRTENLWLHNGRLKFYGPKGWTLVNGAFDATPLYDAVNSGEGKVTEDFKVRLQEAINEGRITYMYSKDERDYTFKVMIVFATLNPEGNTLSLDVNNFDGSYRFNLDLTTNKVTFENIATASTISEGGTNEMVAFSLNNTKEDNRLNLQLAADFLFNKVEAVLIKGVRDGVEYNTIGIYHDGYITAIQKNHYIVFNVSFEDGSITIETNTRVDGLMPYVELQVGDTNEVMQYNIERLPNGEFFMHLKYGYGVGTFQDNVGGFAHITNAYGNELFYTISKEGAIMPDRDYVKPNEPYTAILTDENIGKPLNDVLASQVSKAGEIIINGSSGPITYTRAADSTPNVVYFTDDRKDGKRAILTYNSTNKTITAVLVAGVSIPDANISDLSSVGNTLNSLLESLRNAGVINR